MSVAGGEHRTCSVVWSSGTRPPARKHHASGAGRRAASVACVRPTVKMPVEEKIRVPRTDRPLGAANDQGKNRRGNVYRRTGTAFARRSVSRRDGLLAAYRSDGVFRRRWKVPGTPREIGTKSVSLIMPRRRRPGSLVGQLRLRTESRQSGVIVCPAIVGDRAFKVPFRFFSTTIFGRKHLFDDAIILVTTRNIFFPGRGCTFIWCKSRQNKVF